MVCNRYAPRSMRACTVVVGSLSVGVLASPFMVMRPATSLGMLPLGILTLLERGISLMATLVAIGYPDQATEEPDRPRRGLNPVFFGDRDPASAASLGFPRGVAVASDGSVLMPPDSSVRLVVGPNGTGLLAAASVRSRGVFCNPPRARSRETPTLRGIPCFQRRGRDSNPRWTEPPIPVFETGEIEPNRLYLRGLRSRGNEKGNEGSFGCHPRRLILEQIRG